MKNVLPIAILAPLALIGASYPGDKPGYGPVAAADAVPVTYRPCRPGRGDDRCIQLYERGVRASYARWLRDRGIPQERTQVAMGGPDEARAHHPRRRDGGHHAEARGGRDHRCRQDEARSDGEARGM